MIEKEMLLSRRSRMPVGYWMKILAGGIRRSRILLTITSINGMNKQKVGSKYKVNTLWHDIIQ